jgi:hypothetical protein
VADLMLWVKKTATTAEADTEKTTFDGQADKKVYVQDKALLELTARGFINDLASVPQLTATAKKLGVPGYSNKTKAELQTLLARS